MSDQSDLDNDRAPGEDSGGVDIRGKMVTYIVGFLLAAVLSIASFAVVHSGVIYGPGIPVALIALAIAQMGVHLVFFLHVTSGPDNTNNVLALAFGVLIVGLVLIGSIWIMGHLDHNLMPASMPAM
ncbi:cytochrome o ubiquinol oxidase subunit IV [Sphingomonas sp. RIT328]|uniref:cytochrome o ubiquinol oxidase subunit IV n=1 Tax=Sphingomonas sp. RIT328 TaxID=1470591 RepID=UPI000447F63C|nr:cytochrome o ubiquinol oxidase subunit IV [Sphingomonas sp. RIT328]EZP48853.1 Cytochrome o ubiquinol oxidase subunit IV [Sphingomonas sp. RIT328]